MKKHKEVKLSKLNDFLLNGKLPIERTGISTEDFIWRSFERKRLGKVFNCSFCGIKILPKDTLRLHATRRVIHKDGYYEVTAIMCVSCDKEIVDYFNYKRY